MINQQDDRRANGDIDNTGHESIKLEKNTKGYNWSIRVVLKEDETMEHAFARLRMVDHWIASIYG